MAHAEQRKFFERVKHMHPWSFTDVRVLDCGSLDVNGSLRDLFTGGSYTGIDIVPGRNVDTVGKVHEFATGADGVWGIRQFDTIVSGEMLEHDPHWRESLQRMYELLKPHGLLAISCAGPGRPEHGTRRTGAVWTDPANPDYYRNISTQDIADVFGLTRTPPNFTTGHVGGRFKWWELREHETWPQDTYFWGMKSGG